MKRYAMGSFKRAVFSNIHHKKRFLLMFMIVLIASILLQVSYHIRISASESVEEVRKNIGESIAVFIDNKNLDPRDDSNYFNYDTAKEIALLPEVKESKYLSLLDVFGQNVQGFTLPNHNDLAYMNQDAGDFQLIGVTDMQSYWNFDKGIDHLVEGRILTAADDGKPYAVVSKSLANIYQLKLGDTITIRSHTNATATLNIVGFHSGDKLNVAPEFLSNINFIYTPIQTAIDLNGTKGIMEAEYTLNDPDQAQSFLSQGRAIAQNNNIDLNLLENNLDILLASTALNSLIKTCDAIFITVIAMTAVILSLMVIYLMNDRRFETGILLSLGENRYKIALQMILEILMPSILAINIGVLISSLIIPAIGKAVETGMHINQSLTSTNIGTLFLLANCCGIALVIVASIIPTISIRKYSPKQILQAFK